MPVERLLDDAQHARLYDLYMREARSPSDCSAVLMAEFDGLEINARQISTYAHGRHWGKRKKALINKAERKANRLVNVMAENIAKQKLSIQETHKDFLEKAASVGGKALQKAETFIERSSNARDLSSSVNAAAKSIEIYRKAVGLDDAPNGSLAGNGHTFVFNFARSPESPFHTGRSVTEVESTSVEVDADEVAETSDDPPSEDVHRPHEIHGNQASQSQQDHPVIVGDNP